MFKCYICGQTTIAGFQLDKIQFCYNCHRSMTKVLEPGCEKMNVLREFKGFPVLDIGVEEKDGKKFAKMSFGQGKAKLLVENIEVIKKFAETGKL